MTTTGPGPGPVLDVPLLRWPAEADRRAHLATAGRPRLLVLDAEAPPPLVWDDLEDWVRAPADPVEVQSRIATLAERAATVATPMPVVDADGIVRWRGEWVAVPPIEARLLALLADRVGEVVRREDLVGAAWPRGLASDRTLDGRIKHLRRRLAPLGLVIRTVRGVGFLLEEEAGT
ncbi:MAG TPA: winged helix-turn-helix domain-containing protein [Iamia sp.]